MSTTALARLVPGDISADVRTYRAGRLSPWQLSLERRLPPPFGRAAAHLLNAIGLLQPVDIPPLCPLLVLEITRRVDRAC